MTMFYIWLTIVIILGLIEIFTTNLVSIWFVISGLIAMIISKFTNNLFIQILAFVLIGIFLIPISKRIYKRIKNNNVKTNIDRIIGMIGVVTEDITIGNIGEVKVDGKKWSAYADTNISKKEKVKILSINSVKIKVEKWEEK